jgi:SAM-dependent methyltransferase
MRNPEAVDGAGSVDDLHAFVAAPDLYKWLIDFMGRHLDLSSSSVVDLGAGSGAFARLLADRGADVLGVDLELFSTFRVEGIPFLSHDLVDPELPALVGRKFDALVSIEVIEHVENPVALLCNMRELLAPGGFGFITTPNVCSLPSRIEFLRSGRLRGFRPTDEPTHITPIPDWLFADRLAGLGGVSLQETTTYPEVGFFPGGSRSGRVLDYVLRRFDVRGLLSGESVVWVIRRGGD